MSEGSPTCESCLGLALFSCGGCSKYNYCSVACQRLHWSKWGHKMGCERFQAGKTFIEGPYWRRFYGELSDEEIMIENRFEKMSFDLIDEFHKRKFHGKTWSSHRWLLDEWNKNSKLLLHAEKCGDADKIKELLILRIALNFRLEDYEDLY